MPPNKPLQRSGMIKCLAAGGDAPLLIKSRARVLKGQWPAVERGR